MGLAILGEPTGSVDGVGSAGPVGSESSADSVGPVGSADPANLAHPANSVGSVGPENLAHPANSAVSADDSAFSRLELVWGAEGLRRVRNATVAVFGVGGVGSNCVEALARGGVGRLLVVDGDEVQASNINRQAIAYHSTVGRRKVDVMAAMVADINPEAQVVAVDAFVLPDKLEEAFGGIPLSEIDYIVDAIDTVSTKLALAELAQREGVPLVSSMGGANKLHPELFRFADLYETQGCPLCRAMRKNARKRGIERLHVLYSPEQPVEAAGLGTASYVPPVMGQLLAGYVLRALAGVDSLR